MTTTCSQHRQSYHRSNYSTIKGKVTRSIGGRIIERMPRMEGEKQKKLTHAVKKPLSWEQPLA